MSKRAERTAFGATLLKLEEQQLPRERRLFDDPIAIRLLPTRQRILWNLPPLRHWFQRMVENEVPGMGGSLICRTRFIDDAVREARRRGIHNFVILGAGLDTRAYRLPELRDTYVFEVDLPDIQRVKRRRLSPVEAASARAVTYVPLDFENQSVEASLTAMGFDREEKACFVWEGVTQYIPQRAVNSTLEFVSRLTPGTELVFTYVLKSVIDGTSALLGAQAIVERMKKAGHPWIFGLDPNVVGDYLEDAGLELVKDVGAEFYLEQYLTPFKRATSVSEIERLAVARVSG